MLGCAGQGGGEKQMALQANFERADYCISVDFERDSESPSRVFRAMTGLIESFEQLDRIFLDSVDVNIRPVMLLEDIETGSLRAWLRAALERAPDDALANLEWKKVVGVYLVKAKYVLLDWTRGRAQITNREEVIELQRDLHRLAEATEVNAIPADAPPDPKRLLTAMQGVSDALTHLRPHDDAKLITPDGEAPFNANFSVSPAALEDILTKESLSGKRLMILKVKRPDFLGESQWEFRHGSRSQTMKVRDLGWLQRFHSRKVIVQPGDSLRAEVTVEVLYGHDGEVVAERFYVDKVIEIVEGGSNQALLQLDD